MVILGRGAFSCERGNPVPLYTFLGGRGSTGGHPTSGQYATMSGPSVGRAHLGPLARQDHRQAASTPITLSACNKLHCQATDSAPSQPTPHPQRVSLSIATSRSFLSLSLCPSLPLYRDLSLPLLTSRTCADPGGRSSSSWPGFGFRVWGLGFGVCGLGFGANHLLDVVVLGVEVVKQALVRV